MRGIKKGNRGVKKQPLTPKELNGLLWKDIPKLPYTRLEGWDGPFFPVGIEEIHDASVDDLTVKELKAIAERDYRGWQFVKIVMAPVTVDDGSDRRRTWHVAYHFHADTSKGAPDADVVIMLPAHGPRADWHAAVYTKSLEESSALLALLLGEFAVEIISG